MRTLSFKTIVYNLYLIDPTLLVAVIGITALSDTGGYFVGRRWGRHKLCATISPGKTWQGVFGGLAFVLLVTILVSHYYHFEMFMAVIIAICVERRSARVGTLREVQGRWHPAPAS